MSNTSTSVTAGSIMDRAAILMNDPAKTEYTYPVQIPYLNIALDELIEQLEESNSAMTNKNNLDYLITLAVGQNQITATEHPIAPHYPWDLIEVQEIGERDAGATGTAFRMLTRLEFARISPASNSLGYWAWEDQAIKFNPNGALTPREIQIKYISSVFTLVSGPDDIIAVINCRSFLSFKTAALCAMFIGENETRAEELNGQAELALGRMLGINNKGRQQIMTRHRPFRASYKTRSW